MRGYGDLGDPFSMVLKILVQLGETDCGIPQEIPEENESEIFSLAGHCAYDRDGHRALS